MSEWHDFEAHQKMWGNFVRLVIFSTATVAIALLLMAWFLL